ncbi:dubious [Schizosaccharomyces pombe]|uniref:Uncharacterized protein C1142.09 n=1 Tax=Schizosaccharomyces pombe (strain 972 / ATCC 24843) TaxID=284812 RepID=YKY9_SCHPO|nr:uncharacterized protein SPAC1142.09 [Schizosaccharomyces pombe]Q9P7F5.2 RecName: Full=Uncharacterized protein C1142.09 [Schizosaccharomyces pombe 972h-]CAB77016.2 dubious [Schizosaccharomyces pombe]|eukprot:NP_594273.2 uncharacterized protein SPAC1142.09 [Schizosaccharomyces pombe]
MEDSLLLSVNISDSLFTFSLKPLFSQYRKHIYFNDCFYSTFNKTKTIIVVILSGKLSDLIDFKSYIEFVLKTNNSYSAILISYYRCIFIISLFHRPLTIHFLTNLTHGCTRSFTK